MKGMHSKFRRLLWWGSLTVFALCGAWIAYYLYTAAASTQKLGKIAGEIAALRRVSVPSNMTAATTVSLHESGNPTAASPELYPQEHDMQKKEGIPAQTPSPASLHLESDNPDAQNRSVPQAADIGSEDSLLAYYQSLAEKNSDFTGWITIENTAVDYPVMYTPDDPEKYLHRDFEGRYSFAGLPFLDARCDPGEPSSNMIIYAHNMRSGQMFAEVTKYLEPDFLKAHPTVLFDTLTRHEAYEVIAVLQIDLKPLSDPSMLCYRAIDTATDAAADEWNEYIAGYAGIHTGKVQAGDRILTLSTCKRIGGLDRLVIICRSQGKEQAFFSLQNR